MPALSGGVKHKISLIKSEPLREMFDHTLTYQGRTDRSLAFPGD